MAIPLLPRWRHTWRCRQAQQQVVGIVGALVGRDTNTGADINGCSATMIGVSSAFCTCVATAVAWLASPAGSRMANSSPPDIATVVARSTAPTRPAPHRAQHPIADRMAKRVVDELSGRDEHQYGRECCDRQDAASAERTVRHEIAHDSARRLEMILEGGVGSRFPAPFCRVKHMVEARGRADRHLAGGAGPA